MSELQLFNKNKNGENVFQKMLMKQTTRKSDPIFACQFSDDDTSLKFSFFFFYDKNQQIGM